MATDHITFNDLPDAMSLVLEKITALEQKVTKLSETIGNGERKNNHVLMTMNEACDFLRLKKTTIYYHLKQGTIRAARTGKSYMFFKDELMKWIESGRMNERRTADEMNASLAKRAGKQTQSKI